MGLNSVSRLSHKTPKKDEPGKWQITSDMTMVDLSHPRGNDQPTWLTSEPDATPVQ